MFNKNIFFEKIFELFSNKKIPNIDLHLHTNYTDGKHSPKEMIDFAKKKIFQHYFLVNIQEN